MLRKEEQVTIEKKHWTLTEEEIHQAVYDFIKKEYEDIPPMKQLCFSFSGFYDDTCDEETPDISIDVEWEKTTTKII
jgi:hypothetical protein